MRCPKCLSNNLEGRLYCRRCGLRLGDQCPACHFANDPGDLYCGGCGREIAAPASPERTPETPDPPPEVGRPTAAERRQITVMFCDLVGSTALSEKLDPEDMRDILMAYRSACNEIVDRYEGWIAQFRGDEILIYFGYPEAHEDDPARALRAALEIIPAVQSIEARWQGGAVNLDARIGIDTGLVVVGDLCAGTIDEYMAIVGIRPTSPRACRAMPSRGRS